MKAKSLILLLALLLISISSWAQEYACTHLIEAPETITPPPSQLSLGVILIQFSDWQTNPEAEGSNGPAPSYELGKYKFQHYYNMLFSVGTYSGPGKHPDDHIVYGSMRDYYREVSHARPGGIFDLSEDSDIINSVDGNNVPIWYTASHSKAYYDSLDREDTTIVNEAINLAGSAADNYDKLCIIYAGQLGRTGFSLQSRAEDVSARWYITGEKVNNAFAHIGIHCHEFGHLLGLIDHSHSHNVPSYGHWGLMGVGYKQPIYNYGSRPVHMTGWSKAVLEFAPVVQIDTDMINQEIFPTEIENSNILFRRKVTYWEGHPPLPPIEQAEIFVIENRQLISTSFDYYIPGNGLLIYKQFKILEADGNTHLDTSDISDPGDPFPGSSGNTELTDLTTPDSKVDDGNVLSHFAVLNISENGINITADIIINYWEGTIDSNTTWSPTSSNYYIGGDIIVPTGVTLTVENGAVVDLNNYALKSTGGTIIRQDNVTFNPDIQLLKNGTKLIGQYSTIQQALADAQNGDKIVVNSDILLTSSLDITGDITIELINNHFIKTQPGIITRGPNVVFIPDIRLLGHTSIVGQYATIHRALDDAESQENSVEVHSDITLTANVTVIDDVTLTFKQGITVYLDEYTIKANGGLIIIEENVTFIPDIRLLRNCTTLFGLYPSYSSALADYEPGDCIIFEGYIIDVDSLDISGIAKYYNDNEIPDAPLHVSNDGGGDRDTTNIDGEYFFDNIYPGDTQLFINKEDHLCGAITGSDALLLLQYLAFLATLTEDQKFAADVTEDGYVTGSDVQALLRYLAFYTDDIGSTGEWRFSPEDSSFFHVANAYIDFKGWGNFTTAIQIN